MAQEHEQYWDAPSTTWEWRRVKIRRPPEGEQRVRRSRSTFRRLARRNWYDPLTVVVKYSGGPEAWVVIKTRGAELHVPGDTPIVDVLAGVNSRY